MKNIALFGNAYAGKSTVARALEEDYGYARLALARGVKEAAAKAVNAVYDYLGYYGSSFLHVEDIERDKAVFRPLLQFIGTDLVREYRGDNTAWIRAMLAQARIANERHSIPVVVDDMRFLNEASAVHDAGWLLVFVQTPQAVILERTGMTAEHLAQVYAHPSEQEIERIRQRFSHITFHNLVPPGRELVNRLAVLAEYAKEASA